MTSYSEKEKYFSRARWTNANDISGKSTDLPDGRPPQSAAAFIQAGDADRLHAISDFATLSLVPRRIIDEKS